jgi:ring-1,2-phenylacetyl-CoA epoxidase subunit PaaA
VQFQSLRHGTYLPYARAVKKIEKEEGFHYHHALDLTHQTMTEGDSRSRSLVQSAFDAWFPRVLAYFGPPDTIEHKRNPVYQMGLKVHSNSELRARWVAKIVPIFDGLGVRIDPALATVDDDGTWVAAPLDWDSVYAIIKRGGPRRQDWIEAISESVQRNDEYRQLALNAA